MSTKLKTGDTVEIEFLEVTGDNEKSFKTLVESSDGDNYLLIHSPITNGRVVLVQAGERVKISYSEIDEAVGRYDVFTYKGKIIERKIVDNIAMIAIERLSDIEKVQRRDYFRLNYTNTMQIVKGDMLKSIEVISKDVSLGGMRFTSDEKFENDEHIVCHINFEDKEVVSVRGIVIGNERTITDHYKYQTRVMFEDLPSDKKSVMIRQINLIQSRILKQTAGENYQKNLQEVLPQFNTEKLENYKDDLNFRLRTGYAKGFILFGHIINIAFHFFARPRNNYSASQILGIKFTGDWSPQFLQFGMVISIVLALFSLILNYIVQNHYEDQRLDVLLLSSAFIAIVIFVINLYQLVVYI